MNAKKKRDLRTQKKVFLQSRCSVLFPSFSNRTERPSFVYIKELNREVIFFVFLFDGGIDKTHGHLT